MLPAVESVTLAVPPGWMNGVANLPLSAFASCVVMSLFTNVTVVPTATLTGFGEYAVDERLNAPLTIATLDVEPDGAGVGAGVGVGAGAGLLGAGVELLQAAMQSAARRTAESRIDMPEGAAKMLPAPFARFPATLE